MNSKCQIKIVYSLKLHIRLQELGFKHITEMKNPQHPIYNCWVYEATPEFLKVFDEYIVEQEG